MGVRNPYESWQKLAHGLYLSLSYYTELLPTGCHVNFRRWVNVSVDGRGRPLVDQKLLLFINMTPWYSNLGQPWTFHEQSCSTNEIFLLIGQEVCPRTNPIFTGLITYWTIIYYYTVLINTVNSIAPLLPCGFQHTQCQLSIVPSVAVMCIYSLFWKRF